MYRHNTIGPPSLLQNAAFVIGLLLLSLMLTSCSQVSLTKPQTTREGLVYAYAGVTTARNTTGSLLSANKITPAQARTYQNLADNARSALDLGDTFLAKGDQGQAQTHLQLAQNVLNQLTATLAFYSGDKK